MTRSQTPARASVTHSSNGRPASSAPALSLPNRLLFPPARTSPVSAAAMRPSLVDGPSHAPVDSRASLRPLEECLKAAVLRAGGRFAVEEVPDPVPTGRQAVLRVTY